MSFFDELLAAMTNEPGARQAIRMAGRTQDAQEATRKELAALRKEVATLQRIVAMLSHVVVEGDTDDSDALREKLLSVLEGSGLPTALDHCASCQALLDPDEPALTLRKIGRVCATCFDRGGAG